LYQYLVSNIADFQELGIRLVHEAQDAHAHRQADRLGEVAAILHHFPIHEYRIVGQYYIGWCTHRKGEEAGNLFEKIIEESDFYRALALIEMGSSEAKKGNFDSGIKLYSDAIKYALTPHAIVRAARSIAAIKGMEGYHKQAIKDLERIAPLVRFSQPVEQFQYLNSLAVELGETGRIEEAGSICRVVLASPYVFAYPEWRETAQEIAGRGYRSRSQVSFTEKLQPENILHWPERDAKKSAPSPLLNTATVTQLAEWKKKMGKEPNGEDKKLPKNMDAADMVVMMMNILTREENPDEEKMRKVLEYTIKVFSEK
jgi:tetratricopeptide (TPR) repeat protein